MTSLLLFLSFQVFAQEDLRLEIQNLHQVITETAAEDLSCELDTDCLNLAVGSRACGGPSGFVVTSKNNEKLELLATDIEKVTKLERQYNQETGRISICSIKRPPVVACDQSVCTEVESE